MRAAKPGTGRERDRKRDHSAAWRPWRPQARGDQAVGLFSSASKQARPRPPRPPRPVPASTSQRARAAPPRDGGAASRRPVHAPTR